MTEEELVKEATEYAKLNARQYKHNDGIGFCTSEEEVEKAFLAGAESREKRIVELDKENGKLKEKCNSLQELVIYYQTNFCQEQNNKEADE